jgi:PhoPQ-activated pathogenicity-related protein
MGCFPTVADPCQSGHRARGARFLVLLVSGCLITAATSRPSWAEAASPSPLASYVSQPDDSFGWVKRREGTHAGVSFAELTLTSQTWKGQVWKHQIFVIRPPKLRDPGHAVFMIDGGSWNDELAMPPGDKDEPFPELAKLLAMIAGRIGAPIAVLKQVPLAPTFDGLEGRTAISYTFEQFLKTDDPTWPMLLPMVKSAVRGMDAVQAFTKDQWDLDIQRFTVTGASQRGWTTWLTAAVDPRVIALAPMVIDVVNMGPQMKHQADTFGATSSELSIYNDRGIKQLSTPAGERLRSIVDPFNYRDALRQPKLIVLATNDENSPLDALNLYWNELHGEKYILYVPNNGHEIKDFVRIGGTIAALYRRASGQVTLPQLTWQMDEQTEGLTLNVQCDAAPAKVVAWTASSPTRDFRKAKWSSVKIDPADGRYRHQLPRPEQGFAATFAEAQFADGALPYFFSTNVRIIAAQTAAGP